MELQKMCESDSRIEWDESQWEVIDAPPEDRLLVGAGPGTGKTAVACARISHLIDKERLEPSRIWLISFTRTAVGEIRDRIAACLRDASVAYAVKIATLDSFAWTIHSGFDEEASLLGTYEENIERVYNLVRQNQNVGEYLGTVEHLVIDEAQDIVGIRADLVVELVQKLSSHCGVTVFADEAQAIYGFADDREILEGEASEPLLPEKIRRGLMGTFREGELTQVHRTRSAQLLRIFSNTRRKVLTTTNENGEKLAKIKKEILSLADGKAPHVNDSELTTLGNAFILYRRRNEVLLAASILTKYNVPHRVRMSGLPVYLAPWIGAALAEHTKADLSHDKFINLWTKRVHGTSLATFEVDDAWEHLVRIAGRTETVVDMRLLRRFLGRKQPPAELCHAELGMHGPIVGTIHASKGREADTVCLMLPNTQGRTIDQNEEARVIFVGATRGRSRLLVGHGYRQFANRIEDSGRTYCLMTKNSGVQVEFGHKADIGAEGLVGRKYFTTSADVSAAQLRIGSFSDEPVSLVAEADPTADFAYRLREEEQSQCLAVLSRSVNNDLFKIANVVQEKCGGSERRLPNKILHLHVRGVRTVVLPPNATKGETLHEPWQSSGIMLAPLVLGYTMVYFPSRKGQGMRWNAR